MSSLREAMIMNSRYRGHVYLKMDYLLSSRHCMSPIGHLALIDRKSNVDEVNRHNPISIRLTTYPLPVPAAE